MGKKQGVVSAMYLVTMTHGVLREMFIATLTCCIFYAMYIGMHRTSSLNSYSDKEYFTIFIIFWVLFCVVGYLSIKVTFLTQRWMTFALFALILYVAYDAYSIYRISNQTYLVTTMVMNSIFIVVDVFFLAVLLLIVFRDWTYYAQVASAYNMFDRPGITEESIDTGDKEIDGIIKKEWNVALAGTSEREVLKDPVVVGVIYTILPIETSALVFYILTLVSIDNPTFSDWLYVFHIVTIVFSALWFSTNTNNISIYTVFCCSVFYVFIVDFMQLLLRRGNWPAVTAMRGILCALVLLYALIIIQQGFRFQDVDTTKISFVIVGALLPIFAFLDFWQILCYFCYADAVLLQYIYVAPFAHVAASASAFAFSFGHNKRMGWNTTFVFAAIAFGIDVFYLGTINALRVYTEAQLAIMSFFFIVSAMYIVFLAIIGREVLRTEFNSQYQQVVQAVAKTFEYGLSRESKYKLFSSRVMVPVILADAVITIYYTIILVDQDILITAPKLYHQVHTEWWDWFPMIHYVLMLWAMGNALIVISFARYIGLVFILVGGVLCFMVDVIILAVRPEHNTVGMLIIRLFMIVIVDLGYIAISTFALYDPRDATVSKKDELVDDQSDAEKIDVSTTTNTTNTLLKRRAASVE